MSTNPHDEPNRPGEGGPYEHGFPQGASHQDWRDVPGGQGSGGMPGDWRSTPSYDYAVPRRRTLPTVLAVLLLLSAVCVGIYFWVMRQSVQSDLEIMSEQGVEFIESFIEDLKNERLFAAYGSLSAGYRQRTSQASFDEYVRKHKDALQADFKSHEFKVPPTALVAFGKKVTGEYRAPRKGATKLFIKVVREEGALKIEELTITP